MVGYRILTVARLFVNGFSHFTDGRFWILRSFGVPLQQRKKHDSPSGLGETYQKTKPKNHGNNRNIKSTNFIRTTARTASTRYKWYAQAVQDRTVDFDGFVTHMAGIIRPIRESIIHGCSSTCLGACRELVLDGKSCDWARNWASSRWASPSTAANSTQS